jgi:hypothetical protein
MPRCWREVQPTDETETSKVSSRKATLASRELRLLKSRLDLLRIDSIMAGELQRARRKLWKQLTYRSTNRLQKWTSTTLGEQELSSGSRSRSGTPSLSGLGVSSVKL